MARNKLKRFLAGLCTAAMLIQTAGESGMAVLAADKEEAAVSAVSEDAAEEDEESSTSADEAKESVSASTVSADEAEDEEVSENAVVSEEAEEPDDDQDEDVVEQDDVQLRRLIKDGKVYYDQNEDGVLDSKDTLVGTFDSSTGALVIDANLQFVPSMAFYEWTELKSISFAPNAITAELGNNTPNLSYRGGAFYACSSLETVDFSNAKDLTKIWMYAFRDCTSLKSVTFNDGLQEIEQYAFYNCALTEVTLGSHIIKIGTSVFQNNKDLSKVVLKSATATCDQNIFNGCSIVSFTLAKDDNGIVVFPNKLFYGATFKEDAVIDIGAETVKISESAFQASNIAHVKLSSKLKTIDKNAFNNCKSLAEIDFTPCKDALVTIGESAFQNCIALKELQIADSVSELGKYAFAGCASVRSVKLPDSCKTKDSLKSSIFKGCIAIQKIEFPEGYEYVGEFMFQECAGLKEVEFSSTIIEIGMGAFKSCVNLKEVVLPSNSEFTIIPDSCFEVCASLEVCDLREGITEVGKSAFYACNRYMSELPDSLIKIGDNAFNSSGFCGTLILPPNLAYIGSGAFKDCKDQWGIRGLQLLHTVVITSMDIEKCGEGIFNACRIREIQMQKGATKIPANLFNQASWIQDKEVEIPAEVKEIGEGAFAGSNSTDADAGNLVRIVFPENSQLEIIGKQAFACNAILETFVLPKSVTYIGEKAFYKCAKINSIVIPEKVTTLNASAFEGCSLLENVDFEAIAVTKSGRNIFKDCSLKNIVIGTKITILPDYLFEGAKFQKNSQGKYDMITLELPATVTRIGQYSLTNVVNLKELKFKSGSVLSEIGMNALKGCTGLEKIELPETVTKIDNYAFMDCTSLENFELPKSLTFLGSYAFKNCPKITGAAIPAGVEEVKQEAFCDCIALTEVSFQKTLKKIGDKAFANCPVEGTIKLYEGVSYLGREAFSAAGKNAKTVVYLPESLKTIGAAAFNVAYKDNLEFHVVKGSYAEKWLKDNGFADCIKGYSDSVKTYKVKFNMQGHGTQVLDAVVEKGEKVAKPADPEDEDYTFGGWYTEKACTTAYDFETPVTKDFTLYAKWSPEAKQLSGGKSALDPVPEINDTTTDIYLVQGQKFNIGEGWTVDKAFKKYVSISKTGNFKAKKATAEGVKIKHVSGRNDITVHICKPVIDKKLSLTIEAADQEKTGSINLAKDANIKSVLWYSASPDVAKVDQTGKVTAVGKGTAKVTAYVNGSAYTCTVTVKENVAAANRTMHINKDASKTISVKGVKTAWTPEDTSIAIMTDKKGKKVKAIAAGKTVLKTEGYTIDLYAEDITISGTGVVPGKANKYTITLKKGESTDIKCAYLEQALVLKSSKADIAFVDENGHVEARNKGTSTLTTKINGKKITVTVKVTD